jgi:hypothetical protein
MRLDWAWLMLGIENPAQTKIASILYLLQWLSNQIRRLPWFFELFGLIFCAKIKIRLTLKELI